MRDAEHVFASPDAPLQSLGPRSPQTPYSFKRAADRLIEALRKAASLIESIKSREREQTRSFFRRWKKIKLEGQAKVLYDALKAEADEIMKACDILKSVDSSSRGDESAMNDMVLVFGQTQEKILKPLEAALQNAHEHVEEDGTYTQLHEVSKIVLADALDVIEQLRLRMANRRSTGPVSRAKTPPEGDEEGETDEEKE